MLDQAQYLRRTATSAGKLCLWLFAAIITIAALNRSALDALQPLRGFWGNQDGGDQLNYAIYIAHGKNYFTNPDQLPMLLPQTPGLYPLVLSPFVRDFGPSLAYGNILGLGCFVVTLITVGYVAKQASGEWTAIPIAISVILGMKRVSATLAWNRPDSLALALGALSVGFLIKAIVEEEEKNHLRMSLIVISALLVVLATSTKQLAVAIGVGAIAFLLITGRAKAAAIYCSTSAGLGLAIVLFLEYITRGGFLLNLWTLTNAMTRFSMFHWIQNCGLVACGYIAAIMITFGLVIRNRINSGRLTSGPAQEALLAITISTGLMGVGTCWHIGGGMQYLSYSIVTLSMLNGAIFSKYLSKNREERGSLIKSSLAVCCILFQVIVDVELPFKTLKENWFCTPFEERDVYKNLNVIVKELQILKGPMFFDRLPGLGLKLNRPIEVETSALSRIRERGLWNPSVLKRAFNGGKWRYVVRLSDSQALFLGMSDFENILTERYEQIRVYPLVQLEHSRVNVSIWQQRTSRGTGDVSGCNAEDLQD